MLSSGLLGQAHTHMLHTGKQTQTRRIIGKTVSPFCFRKYKPIFFFSYGLLINCSGKRLMEPNELKMPCYCVKKYRDINASKPGIIDTQTNSCISLRPVYSDSCWIENHLERVLVDWCKESQTGKSSFLVARLFGFGGLGDEKAVWTWV